MDQLPTLPSYMFDRSLSGIVSLLLTIVLPVLVGLLVKQSWSAGVKYSLLVVLAGGKTMGEAYLAVGNQNFDLVGTVWSVGINVGIAMLAYWAWANIGVTQAAQKVLVKDKPAPLKTAGHGQ